MGSKVSDAFPFSRLPVWQHTLGGSLTAKGVGLHTGKMAGLSLHPAPPNSGLVFVRTDLNGKAADIVLRPDAVHRLDRGTTIVDAHQNTISTIEHLLAALCACGVDNARIEVSGPEIPAMDGSALPFCDRIAQTGLQRQEVPRRYMEICKPIEISEGGKTVRLGPGAGLHISATIDYPDTLIGQQSYKFDLNARSFIETIAPARTFGQAHEVDALHQAGLALGGSLDNCLVVDGQNLQNQGGLRFADEFVRHKIVDILGDLALVGAPILGCFTSHCAGHKLNNALLRKVLGDGSSWRWSVLADDGKVSRV